METVFCSDLDIFASLELLKPETSRQVKGKTNDIFQKMTSIDVASVGQG